MKITQRVKVGLSLLIVLLLTACSSATTTQPGVTQSAPEKPAEQQETPKIESLVLATTTSTQDSGLLDFLLPEFEQNTGIEVKVVAVGTGQAIKLGEDGNADVLLVHSRKAEDEFVENGYGSHAHDVMYNQFYIVGPEADPANIKAATTATEAFENIAQAEATFISRGDDSGTDKKEKSIWKSAGIEPTGAWYLSSGQGMGATLQMADEKNAYTLTDEATFLSRTLGLIVLMEGDQELLNPYGIMMVKSTEKPEVAKQLIDFFVSEEGQKLIGEFGVETYGKGLFVPDGKKR